jgi:formylmethanofuran dehydrogenase subunit E
MVKAGDSVVCRIRDGCVISMYEGVWQEEVVFDIVSVYAEGYLIYIPQNMFLKDSIHIVKDYKKYNAEKRFANSYVLYITDYNIIRTHTKMDGMRCRECDEFQNYATSNQTDGSLICWSCTNYKQWKSTPED